MQRRSAKDNKPNGYLDGSPHSDKDSDYSKRRSRWSRRRRSTYAMAEKRHSLRRSTKRRYECLTQSEEEEEDDERIFTPIQPRARRLRLHRAAAAQNNEEASRSHSDEYDSRPRLYKTSGGHHLRSGSQETPDGIRRSTRTRKLKYDSCRVSWILDSQRIRGYPSYGDTPYNPSSSMKAIKEEEEEAEDEEEEEEEEPERAPPPRTRRRRAQTQEEEEEEETPQPKAKEVKDREEEAEEAEPETKEEDSMPFERIPQRTTRQHAPPPPRDSSPESDSSSAAEQVYSRRPRRLRTTRSTGRTERPPKYHLRQTKPVVDRFQPGDPGKARRSGRLREMLNSVRKRLRRSSSSSSSDSSDTSPDPRDRKKGKTKSGKRMELCGGGEGKSSTRGRILADVAPVQVDSSITFENVGGLQKHISCLKEMVVFPIMYSEIFSRFGVTPPKGVLFHGPPGTGKTLVARALANECSKGARKVSFFMRKGADCLSKWVGESERQLRLLFHEAKEARPSIIFFDELDGLAPVRSTKQDQIHASIVCTLLALMDGLDNRGDIVVIGATNRIDSIDPALRRPGRFDRELYFPLPGMKERRDILKIHSGSWGETPVLNRMAEASAGYCGSDLKSLCTEAVLQALKRVYPQIYESQVKLLLDPDRVKVSKVDFLNAFNGIVPAAQRSVSALGRKLPPFLEPLLGGELKTLLQTVSNIFPASENKLINRNQIIRSPRLLVVGEKEETTHLVTALLYKLEHIRVFSLGLEAIFEDATSTEEKITKTLKEVSHSRGSILWFGDLNLWWGALPETAKAVFLASLAFLDPRLEVLFLATSTSADVPEELHAMFSSYRGEVMVVPPPTSEQKSSFLRPLFYSRALRPPSILYKKKSAVEPLPIAPPSPPPKLSEDQLQALYNEEENTLRELRIFLRQICAKLARNKLFYMFCKPVDINEVPDYLTIIKEPMDLETMMTKIDLHKYTCARDFLDDIDLLCKNALEYNPDRDPADKVIRNRACYLRDTAYALIKAEMDSDFEVSCRKIRDARKERIAITEQPPEERYIREFFPLNDEPNEENETKDGTRETEEGPSQMDEEGSASKPRKKKQVWGSARRRRVRKSTKQVNGLPDEPNATSTPSTRDRLNHSQTQEDEDEGRGNESCLSDLVNCSIMTELSPGEERVLEIDKEDLFKVHEEAVAAVSQGDIPLESLINFYSHLKKKIDSFSKLWDRKRLPQELRLEVERFLEHCTPTPEDEDQADEEVQEVQEDL